MHKYRSLFISDIHFGSAGCSVVELLSFLKEHNNVENVYLLGDVFDFWIMKNGIRWNSEYTAVIQQLLKMSRRGTRVVYIPGNHDEALREFIGLKFDTIEIRKDDEYYSLDGRRFYLTHGDQFDNVVKLHPTISRFGSIAYDTIVKLNRWINKIRQWCGWTSHWSFSSFVKKSVKDAVKYISNYENVLTLDAKKNNYDGIICGHIHAPCVKRVNGLDYINCGDMVENMTLAAEDVNGHISIVRLRHGTKASLVQSV